MHEEARPYNNPYVWTDDLAARTGRVVAGPAGLTSTEYTLRGVKAALEGEGTVIQEARWAGPDGSRRLRSSGSLRGTRLVAAPEPHQPATTVDQPSSDETASDF